MILFGELYGSGVQDMAYGLANGAKGFRAFDIAVDGKYLDYDEKVAALERFGVEMSAASLPGPLLLGGGRRAHLRTDDPLPARSRRTVQRAEKGAS